MDRERDARPREDHRGGDQNNQNNFRKRKRNRNRGGKGFDAKRLGHLGDNRRSDWRPQDRPRNAQNKINREKTCPFLLRVFPKVGGHHKLDEFGRLGQEPKSELRLYTWKDATLREVCERIQEVNASSRRPSARLSFALVYPDKSGRNVMRQIGVLDSKRRGTDDDASLGDVGFQTGDFLSAAIY